MDEEVASALRAARGAVQDVVNIIAIQTMLVLVRNPASRNSSSEERKWLEESFACGVGTMPCAQML
eukprot:624157-Lingulodinium_polyedra.AAC.1